MNHSDLKRVQTLVRANWTQSGLAWKLSESCDTALESLIASKLDLKYGCHQIKVKENDIHNTYLGLRMGAMSFCCYLVQPIAPAMSHSLTNEKISAVTKFVLFFLMTSWFMVLLRRNISRLILGCRDAGSSLFVC